MQRCSGRQKRTPNCNGENGHDRYQLGPYSLVNTPMVRETIPVESGRQHVLVNAMLISTEYSKAVAVSPKGVICVRKSPPLHVRSHVREATERRHCEPSSPTAFAFPSTGRSPTMTARVPDEHCSGYLAGGKLHRNRRRSFAFVLPDAERRACRAQALAGAGTRDRPRRHRTSGGRDSRAHRSSVRPRCHPRQRTARRRRKAAIVAGCQRAVKVSV